MNLKNYTSEVPVSKTISRIEEALARAGVMGIAKDYDPHGKLLALTFKIQVANEAPIVIRMPANVEAVYKAMARDVKKPHAGTMERIKEQAERTAWRLMQDWIEVQLSLIQMGQAEHHQVFLPYIWDGKRTYYDFLKEGGFKQLTAGTQ